MLLTLLITVVMILITTIIHAGGMNLTLHRIRERKRRMEQQHKSARKVYWICSIILQMVLVSLVEVFAWALVYLSLGAIDGFERALYFSMITFTTLGYGDIILQEQWRLLGAFEAGIGIIMFGWTTAIVFAAVQHVSLDPKSKA